MYVSFRKTHIQIIFLMGPSERNKFARIAGANSVEKERATLYEKLEETMKGSKNKSSETIDWIHIQYGSTL